MSQNIVEQLKTKIAGFQPGVKVEQVGTVLEVADGVARVSGLTEVASMEMLDFGGVMGVALNLEENLVGSSLPVIKPTVEFSLLAVSGIPAYAATAIALVTPGTISKSILFFFK